MVEAAASRAACCRFESCAAHQLKLPSPSGKGIWPTPRHSAVRVVREHHLMACSSMVEPALDRRLTWVRFPTGQPWTRSLKPEWRGSGLLTRGPVDRNHSRPLLHPWTSYRSGRTGRTLNPLAMPIAGSNPAWSPTCLYPNGRGNASRARPVLVRVEPGTPFWRLPCAIVLRCYASGEAARLSIERDGFESRTARHFIGV